MKIIFLFIDGLGLGMEDKERNPLYSAHVPNYFRMMKQYRVIPTDATLGVEGLPQSATGQTTILTGKNASKVLGKHLHGQPTETLKKIIAQYSLFKVLLQKGVKVTNANVYRDHYLKAIQDPKERKIKPSASTVACLVAGIPLRTVEDLKQGNGIYHDITNDILIESGYDVPRIAPKDAAKILYKISEDYDFTFFEYFLTDLVGHSRVREKSEEVLEILDEFIGELDKLIDYTNTLLIITSDHGNIEDLSVKTHTLNKVPTVVHGKYEDVFAAEIRSLTDIHPAVIKVLEQDTIQQEKSKE